MVASADTFCASLRGKAGGAALQVSSCKQADQAWGKLVVQASTSLASMRLRTPATGKGTTETAKLLRGTEAGLDQRLNKRLSMADTLKALAGVLAGLMRLQQCVGQWRDACIAGDSCGLSVAVPPARGPCVLEFSGSCGEFLGKAPAALSC